MGMKRPIDQRYKPPVAGIDLEQSLNYVELDVAGEAFCYDHYTSSHLPYVKGQRLRIEMAATQAVGVAQDVLSQVQAIARYVASEVLWAGYYEKRNGTVLPANQDLTEEKILEQRFGWCNEQARLFCCLTQAVSIPSRIVFAVHKADGLGHCMGEVLSSEGWMLVDQSVGFCFLQDGQPRSTEQVRNDESIRAYFLPRYKKVYEPVIEEIGEAIMSRWFKMIMVDDPLEGLHDVGFHNHYLR